MGLQLGEILALLTTLAWSICIFPFTEASRRMGPNEINIFRLTLATLMLSVLSMIIGHISVLELFSLPSFPNWFWLALSGVIGLGLGDYFGFTMYVILGTRTGSILSTFAPGAALMVGYIMLGESINSIGMLGMAITIIGVIVLIMSKKESTANADFTHGNKTKGVIFGILAAICQGAGLALSKKGMEAAMLNGNPITPIHATWIRILAATLTILIGIVLSKNAVKYFKSLVNDKSGAVKYALLGTVFGPVLGVSLSLYTIALIKVSIAQTIFALAPVMVLVIGLLVYREKITLKSLLAAAIAISGVMVLIWRNELILLF
jgi:drug/metabolite transporter (DMT)-like permease